jgi:hypothetical protein
MKSLRNKIRGAHARTYLFANSPAGKVQVDVRNEQVLIRCSRRRVSADQRTAFVQYLVDEGFIKSKECGANKTELGSWLEVTWRVDATLPGFKPATLRARLDAFMIRVLGCSFVLCAIEMVCLLVLAARG